MSILRLRALQRFADRVGECVPSLKGRVCGGHAESPKRLGFPHLSVRAIRFSYLPDQASIHCALGASAAVFNVGRVEATVQLRLGAQSARQRYQLEQEVLERVFWADIDRPGIVLLDVPDCYDARIAFELDSHEWEDEAAFEKQWYSVATVALQMPALVMQGSVFDIEHVYLTLTDDLASPIGSVPESAKQTVSVAEDGSITPAANP